VSGCRRQRRDCYPKHGECQGITAAGLGIEHFVLSDHNSFRSGRRRVFETCSTNYGSFRGTGGGVLFGFGAEKFRTYPAVDGVQRL